MRRLKNVRRLQDAELDITAFMNLMIVLVPVLLLGMVFSQITVLDLNLPDSASESEINATSKTIELVISEEQMFVNYPEGILLKRIPKIDVAGDGADNLTIQQHDFAFLSLVLQELKRQLAEKNNPQRAISILSDADTHYQTIVSAMDTVRSYKAVLVTSVVDAELFPVISLGDSPQTRSTSSEEEL